MTDAGPYRLKGKRVWVAGHKGMVGSAVVARLLREDCEILTVDRAQADLRNQEQTADWLQHARPDVVIVAAAKVGGIVANDENPAPFLYDNLMIAANAIHESHRAGVEKLLFLGSSCIYPRDASQPMREEELLTGPLESTNEWYAVAKIAGIKLCQAYRRQYGSDFISAMPTNLYGPGDNFHPRNSHVVAALMRKAHLAKINGEQTLEVWGSGTPRREFLYVDDAADAVVHLMKVYSEESHINIGCGADHSITDLARMIMGTTSFEGDIVYRREMPDGTPRKLLDVSRLTATGWLPRVSLADGLAKTYDWFRENVTT